MEREKKNRFISFTKVIVFYLFVYGTMLIKHYSSDSFTYANNPKQNNIGNLALGRIGDYWVNKIILKFGINYVEQQIIFVTILILTLAVVSEVLYAYYLKLIGHKLKSKQEKILKASIILMFCNVFIEEWFIFVEMTFMWSLSLIFMFLAVIQIREKFTIRRMLLSATCVVVSVSFYQATIGYYIIFSLIAVYIMNNGELNKKSILDSVKVLICGACSGVLNLQFIKILQLMGLTYVTGRTETISLKMVIGNVRLVLQYLWRWISDSYGLLPKYSVLIIGIITYFALIFSMIKNKISKKNTVYIIGLIIICNGIVYFPHLLTSTIWMAQRTIPAFFVIISLPLIIMAIKEDTSILINICILITVVVLGINIWKINEISVNVIASNKIDEEVAYQIQEKIEDYEMKTKNQIDTIALGKDGNTTWGNKSIQDVCMDTNIRIYNNVFHGGIDCVNYYNGTNYNKMDMPEDIYKKYFLEKDWQELDLDEQLVFENNIAYLVTY